MPALAWLAVCLAACAVVGVVAYQTGFRQAARRAQDDIDRLHRVIDPEGTRHGVPTNLDAPPARVTTGRYKQRRRWDLQR